MDEEHVEHFRTAGFLLGISGGWEEASKYLRQRSGDFWLRKHDGLAQMLRDMADELMVEQRVKRKTYDDYNEEHKLCEA